MTVSSTTTAHKFDESKWTSVHADIVNPSSREVDRVARLKVLYPELSHWGTVALDEAWGWYSQDCWLVNMMKVNERDPWFLGYIYQVEQGHPINSWYGNTLLAAQGVVLLELVNQ